MGLTSADLARLGPDAQKQVRKAMSRERRQAERVLFLLTAGPSRRVGPASHRTERTRRRARENTKPLFARRGNRST